MGEYQGDALVGRQGGERPLQLVVIGKPSVIVSVIAGVSMRAPKDSLGRRRLRLRQVTTGVDQQPMQPGLEPIRFAQAAQVAPAAHDGVLGGVLGGLAVAKDPVGDAEEALVGRADQRLERGVVACLRLPDQVCGHRSPRPGRGHLPR